MMDAESGVSCSVRRNYPFPGCLQIPSIDFRGYHSISPNEEFLVGWQDADYRSWRSGPFRAGFRASGMGRVIVLRRASICWVRDLERPNDGEITDTGHAVINDWQFGNGLKGTFYCFSPQGKTLVRATFRANLWKPSIAADASLAWCRTLASDVVEDSGKLIVFSLRPPCQCVKISPRRLEILGIRHVDSGVALDTATVPYIYDWDGTLRNAAEAERAEELFVSEHGHAFERLALAEERLKLRPPQAMDLEEIAWVTSLLQHVAQESKWQYLAARAERRLGEIVLITGGKRKALAHFRAALLLDPKVGVKRLAASLEREMGCERVGDE